MFGKKKEKYHTLDRGLLAEAISIYSKQISFGHIDGFQHINELICLSDVLKIKILYVHYHFGKSLHYYSMKIETYVEDIRMAIYHFTLDIDCNTELYRKWKCDEKEIIHYMPNQFIDLMNQWSKRIVSTFNEERTKENRKKEEIIQKRYDKEEDVLRKYR